jgi:hypothetical protein
MVWAGAMTVLLAMAIKDVRRLKQTLADERLFSTESAEIERHYQEKISALRERVRMLAPWVLPEDER